MIGLDVTHQALCLPAVQERFAALGTPQGDFVDGLMTFFRASYATVASMPDPPVHDPCAVALVIDPTVMDVVPATVQIETVGRWTSGMTVVDFDAPAASRHRVATSLRADRFWTLVEDAVTRLGRP
jgi:purine nucleosidase